MPNFNDLPPEITLEIFPNMLLKGLISAEGVCRRWKELISQAAIHPVRLALLKLYQKTVSDPLFLPTRPWLLANLRPFDRQAYVDALLAQHNYLPEDFRLWILEWPARATIACAWPGLPDVYSSEGADDVERIVGYNFLGSIPPLVHRITLDLTEISLPDTSSDGEGAMDEFRTIPEDCGSDSDGSEESQSSLDVEEYYRSREKFNYSPPGDSESGPIEIVFPALIIWERDDARQTWLVLDPNTPFSVFLFHYGSYSSGYSRQYTTWISWLEAQLRRIHREARHGEGPAAYPPSYDENGRIVSMDESFRSSPRYEQLWTSEDETHYRAAT
ncbi:hypothetical protein B0H13DRAFT_2561845 [Mycena leptocephala]|nr:hypothetical protein B0H13DRAFT_2561845 [Mycena leptocephala]